MGGEVAGIEHPYQRLDKSISKCPSLNFILKKGFSLGEKVAVILEYLSIMIHRPIILKDRAKERRQSRWLINYVLNAD